MSDWSSDVCSSDLEIVGQIPESHRLRLQAVEQAIEHRREAAEPGRCARGRRGGLRVLQHPQQADGGRLQARKSVKAGTGVTVRVAVGGRRRITKKNT